MKRPYYSENLHRESIRSQDTYKDIDGLVELISSDEINQDINNGNLTVAMIRPSLEASTLQGFSDQDAADSIEESIFRLGVAAKFSVTFDKDSVDLFYDGAPREVQTNLPPERYTQQFSNRWEEFVSLMTSGPSTVLLLYNPDGEAVRLWREQVGHYDIVGRRDVTNIRGQFGLDNYNNLIHGSDSASAAKNELSIIRDLLLKEKREGEKIIRHLGISTLDALDVKDTRQVKIENPWAKSGETFFSDITVNESGESEHLIVKACTKFYPSECTDEWVRRRETISNMGISTPDLRAIDGATIVEEYIPYRLQEAYSNGSAEVQEVLENEFIAMYEKIVEAGFQPINGCFSDVRSRGEDIVLVDFGSDLGGSSKPTLEQVERNLVAEARKEFQRIVKN